MMAASLSDGVRTMSRHLANWHVHHNYLFHVAGGGWVYGPLKLVLTLAYVHGSWLKMNLTASVCVCVCVCVCLTAVYSRGVSDAV